MWYPAAVTTPAAAAIPLVDAKLHCRVDSNLDDTLITSLISAAEGHCEKYCGIRVGSQTLTLMCDSFCDLERLPEGPVSAITSISYVDTAQATQTLANTVYELRASGLTAGISLKYGQFWPAIGAGSRITVVLVAGFSIPPAELIAGMKMLIGHWYENREAVTADNQQALPIGPAQLFENFRRFA